MNTPGAHEAIGQPVSTPSSGIQEKQQPAILFGVVAFDEELQSLERSAMASGGLSLGYPPPVSSAVKWDPASRAPLNLTGPSNMSSSLRRGSAIRNQNRPPEPALALVDAPAITLSPKLLPQSAVALPVLPVASTSKAQPAPIAQVQQQSVPFPVGGAPIELGTPRGDQSGLNGRPPLALALRPDHSPLATGRTASTPTSPRSPVVQQMSPPRTVTQSVSGVSFSRSLKPPINAENIVMVDERPAKANRILKSSLQSNAPAATSPTDTPLASSEADLSTAPTSPLLKSSPPTRGTSPRPSVLKPKSWADLLKSPTPARKRVSIALPASDDGMSPPTSPSSVGPITIRPAPAKAGLPAKPPAPLVVPQSPPLDVSRGPIAQPMSAPLPAPVAIPAPAAPAKRKLEETLRGVESRQTAPAIQPRGLVNKGNQCFENSILQCLLFCGPFYNLLRLLGQETSHDFSSRFACLEAMIAFVAEFTVGRREDLTSSQHTIHVPNGPRKPTVADAFAPEMVYDALRGNKRFEVMMRGSQEDAQEFLGFLLDTLHEELLALIDQYDGTEVRPQANGTSHEPEPEDDGWLEVGSKGRMATTRSMEARESPISRIFAGKQRSTLRVPGQKDSATVEPFLTLQLDIAPDSVETIEDAIANICTTDTLSDYTARPGVRVDASKQFSLEALPPVLILHLKRFAYDAEAEQTLKDHKVIGFGTELEIAPAWLSPAARANGPIKYALSAVVYHHGRNATGGHYTVSLRKQDGQWIDIDDTVIYDVGPADVAVDRTNEVLRLSLPSSRDQIERTAYLLFWTRAS